MSSVFRNYFTHTTESVHQNYLQLYFYEYYHHIHNEEKHLFMKTDFSDDVIRNLDFYLPSTEFFTTCTHRKNTFLFFDIDTSSFSPPMIEQIHQEISLYVENLPNTHLNKDIMVFIEKLKRSEELHSQFNTHIVGNKNIISKRKI